MLVSNITIDPRFLPFTAWADAVIIENGALPRATDETHWKDWAMQVVRVDGRAPDPTSFADWRVWATAWIGAQ